MRLWLCDELEGLWEIVAVVFLLLVILVLAVVALPAMVYMAKYRQPRLDREEARLIAELVRTLDQQVSLGD